MVEYTERAGSRALGKRGTILKVIQQNPGITKGEVRLKTGFGQGTVHYHLEVLCRGHLISTLRRNNRLHLFDQSVHPDDQKPLSVLFCTYARAIVRQLSKKRRVRLTELSDELEASRKVIRRCLASLEDCELILRRGEHQSVYALTGDVDRFLPHCEE